jgi:hypothetical protein
MAAWKRLLADVQQLVARMRMGEDGTYPIFRNSTVENVRATAESLATLNVFGDAELETVRQRVIAELCYADPDTLRKSDTVRDAVAASGENLLADMLGILGEWLGLWRILHVVDRDSGRCEACRLNRSSCSASWHQPWLPPRA